MMKNIVALVWFFLASAPGYAATPAVPVIFSTPLKTIDGTAATLAPYQGKVLLIVNTASQCGFTPQYEGLERLYQKFKSQGLVVLGFQSNDFNQQEPGTNAQIKLFCTGRYKVSFPLFEKGKVVGDDPQPLYKALRSIAKASEEVTPKWNFEKILISRTGELVQRFRSGVTPNSEELGSAIERELAKK